MATISTTHHFCSICGKDTINRKEAKDCQDAHNAALKKKIPKYKIGQYVMAERSLGSGYVGQERAKIVKIEGKLFETRLLVENENEERYWDGIVNLGNNLRDDPGDFRRITPIVD